jgi:hypothetical protein
VTVIDRHAARQDGAPYPLPKPTRRRTRAQTPPAELPEVDGKFFARLDLGKTYTHVPSETMFRRGVAVEIDKAL